MPKRVLSSKLPRNVRQQRTLHWAVALTLALSAAPFARAQDFDPRGRHRPTPKSQPAPRSNPGHPGPAPAPASKPETATPAAVLVERYTKIVLAQAGSPFPLQRLAQLYRDKDGNLSALVKDFEARAGRADSEQYAASVALAGIYKLDGRTDDAAKTLERAIALKSTDASAILTLARLLQDRGEVPGARARYEQALPLQTAPADREPTLRTLMELSLDGKDYAAAKGFHQQLVKLHPEVYSERGAFGRELYQRGEYERAESEFRDYVQAAAGDNRLLPRALTELGRAQGKAHKNQEAIATLKRALSVAGQEAAVRAEIYESITEIYRADQQLGQLVAMLEGEHPTDFARLALLGALYEETGDAPKALEAYRKALAINPRHVDLRLKMIRLLQSQGELDKAIAEYEGLIRAAPNNPQFVFEECEALMQRGDRARALKLLGELEARATGDEEVLSRLADFYGRIGEGEKSTRVLQRLTQVGGNDPSHLVDLGDRYFQDGNHPLAVQTWKRILTTVNPRARALSALGDVYLEHDMTQDALQALREAVSLEPQSLAYKKQLAGALERARSYRDARALWEELAEKAKTQGDKLLAREARSRIVTLWGMDRMLDAQVAPLTAKFAGGKPDVEAGRTLAEVQIHLRKVAEGEATLRRVIELAPGDADSYLALERVLVQENKLPDAIAVLEKLVIVEPKRARELYQRMAQYALQLYKDDDAIKYAARAVELNPDDAEGHRRLGEMYRSRQDGDRAIVEFRAAIAKNDRLYIVYFELADLLLSKGEADEADRLFRRVVRGAPDEELVARAARLSMQINLGKRTLESLEQELLPLAIGNPQKNIYRRLLVEIYGNLTFGLVQRVRHADTTDATEARAALARVGARAVKPLLDALADGDASQQRVAIDVLGYVENKNAGPSLFAFATGSGDTRLRTRAMLACGALRDPALVPKYEGLLLPGLSSRGDKPGKGTAGAALDDAPPNDAVAVAAAWGLARMGDKRALPALRALAQRGAWETRALAVLGLGLQKDRASTAQVAQIARAADAGNAARAAAAYALGEFGAESETATLLNLAEGTDPLPRQMALVALARLAGGARGDAPAGRAALGAMADAVFAGTESVSPRARASADALRRAGSAALIMLANRSTLERRLARGGAPNALAVPDDALDVETALEQLVPRGFSDRERAAALVEFADPLRRAAISALQTSAERARAVLDAMNGGSGAGGAGAFEPFVSAGDAPDTAPARAKAKELAAALEPYVIAALARHPDPQMRTKAIVLLARSPSDAATAAVVQAVGDPSESVQRIALDAIGGQPNARAVAAVGTLLEAHDNWAVRVLAAQAMGRLGASGSREAATRALRDAATKDGYALVREAALVAMRTYDATAARELGQQMAGRDAEPRVRETAKTIASGRP
jgi:cellulose synthase operon protein C